MKLYGSSRSPYVRKVLIAAHETGTIGDMDIEMMTVTAKSSNPRLLRINPLGQIPTLVLDDGEVFYDSAVICRYLDLVLGEGRLHPREIAAELAMMRRLAVGDGLIATLMNLLAEQTRCQPDHSDLRIAAIMRKLPRIFSSLDAEADSMAEAPFDMSQITIIAALCYVDFRLSAEWPWRDGYPALARWFAIACARSSVVATAYFDEQGSAGTGQAEKVRTQ